MARRPRTTPANPPAGPVREFMTGVSILFRGLGVWATAPRLMVLGMIPPVLVGIAFAAGLIALGVNVESVAAWLTPFAADWNEPFRTAFRVLAALATAGVAVLVVIYAFTTATLVIGQPFYERIWVHVERRSGSVPENPLGFWRAALRGLGAGVHLLVPAILLSLVLFVIGFVPVVGQILAVLIGATLGGWLLAVELTGLAFDNRGHTLRDRRRLLRSRRASVIGFGAATYLVFLLPLGAVVMMPAAVAGATLLARRALGEPMPSPRETTEIGQARAAAKRRSSSHRSNATTPE